MRPTASGNHSNHILNRRPLRWVNAANALRSSTLLLALWYMGEKEGNELLKPLSRAFLYASAGCAVSGVGASVYRKERGLESGDNGNGPSGP